MVHRLPEGSLAMLRAAWRHVTHQPDGPTGELYQTSVMSALMDGVYEGEVTYGEIRQHGDFGLGTFNDLDGEMVGLDGNFYQLRSDGSAHAVEPSQKTPFAVVTFFRPDREIKIVDLTSKEDLSHLIESATDANLFAAIRVDGEFDVVRTRTVKCQQKPFPPLTEAAADESVSTFNNIRGTLAGFRSPQFSQGIEVAGLHLHFLREDRQAGGHALDYSLRRGTLQVEILKTIHIELPATSAFREAHLDDPALDKKIRSSEG